MPSSRNGGIVLNLLRASNNGHQFLRLIFLGAVNCLPWTNVTIGHPLPMTIHGRDLSRSPQLSLNVLTQSGRARFPPEISLANDSVEASIGVNAASILSREGLGSQSNQYCPKTANSLQPNW